MLSTQLWNRPSQKGFNCQEQELGLCERLALWRASRGARGAAAWSYLTRRKVSLLGWKQPCSSVLSRLDLPLWNLLFFSSGSFVTFYCSNQRQRPGARIHGLGNRVHQVILLLSNAQRGHGDRRWSADWPGRCLQPGTLGQKRGFSRNDVFKSWSPSEAMVQILQTLSEFPVAS